MSDQAARLVVILGDQLNPNISSLNDFRKNKDRVVLMEVMDEATYVPHHQKKVAFLFSAMRHFAQELRDRGLRVDYIQLEDSASKGSFTATVKAHVNKYRFGSVIVTHPGEWRVLEEIQSWEGEIGLPVEIREDDRFFCSIEDFQAWAKGKKTLRMEHFYRWMRKESELLMEGPQPVGGVWNLDKENRKALPKDLTLPKHASFKPNSTTQTVLDLVGKHFGKHMGSLDDFDFAVTRKEAKKAFSHFLKHALPQFGPFQDAMKEGEYYLFHSVISQYLNCGLLDPREICQQVEQAYLAGNVPLQSAEGYIRQVLGWREFVRGIYWNWMPSYGTRNGLKAKRALPTFYWDAKTDMNCMRCVLEQTRDTATSHHIQRLMVTGNFALLAGLNPTEVCEWYLAVYADAYEWVELPNTLGMALHGDHGVLGSKPYAASGAYINRMSDFCKDCRYKVKERTGPNACPFNFLYWDFMARHEKEFRSNPRMGFVYKNLGRMNSQDLKELRREADKFLKSLNT